MLQSRQPDEFTIVDVAMSPRGNCTMSQFTIGLAESHQHSSNDNVLSGPPAVTRQEIPEPFHCCSSSSRHGRSHRLGNTCGTCRNSTFAHIASQQEIIASSTLLRAQPKQDHVRVGDNERQPPNLNLCMKEARMRCCCFLDIVDASSLCFEME